MVVGILLKDRALLMYAEDVQAMDFVESRDCVVMVLEDDKGRTVVQVSTMP